MSVASRLKELLRRVVAAPASATAPAADAPTTPVWAPPEQWADQFGGALLEPASWLQQRRERGRLYADLTVAQVDSLRSRWPARVSSTRDAADRVCAHEFDLLGSGPTVVVDPDRRRSAPAYQPIDWAIDPTAGLRFPQGFPHKAWNPSMRPGLADIKWPWEIGRCQHWVTLGQAYRFTGDERYAREILDQHADFLEVNPVGVGTQFVCTMDVAIRAFNWALAFELIRSSACFDAAASDRAYRSLFDVGLFIEGNLENTYEVTSNHFLSNIVGLYGVAVVFRDLPAGRRWIGKCREWLETEMRVQILEDGADYESSVPYHRLVAELFLGAARVAEVDGAPLSEFYLRRLRQMIDFHVASARPDGLMPQVGDADDGRLHIFTDYGTWQPQDGRHLAGAAGMMFDEPLWLDAGGDDGLWEAAWWGFDTAAITQRHAPAAVNRLFPDAGLAVVRHGGNYLLVTNGRVGTNGFGNHKHNDLLGFELHLDGVPLIVDPGSYVYTSNPDARNLFRGTAYHSTVMIDGVEQNDVRLDYLFRMFETSTVEHLAFDEGADHVEYRGRHTGYERLPSPVTHERSFRLMKSPGKLAIVDRFTGSGSHAFAWHFHLAPGLDATEQQGAVVLSGAGRRWRLQPPPGLTPAIVDAWYSPSFGVRHACRAVNFSRTADVAAMGDLEFTIQSMAG